MLRTWMLDEFKQAVIAEAAAVTVRDKEGCVSTIEEAWDDMNDGERSYVVHYYICLFEGCSEKLADMFAAQAPPGAVSDTTFLANYRDATVKVSPMVERARREVAERMGQSTGGKVYISQLAAFPGDPQAWVDGRSDIERVCRQRGMGCDGAVNITTPDMGRLPGRKRKPLAQKLHEAGLPIASEVPT